MIKTLTKYICVLGLVLLCSCSSSVKKVVKGFWAVDFMEYSRNQDILYECGANILIFENDKCTMPTYLEDCKNPSKNEGTWKITQQGDQYFITIDTKNDFFAGTHKICFKKDYKKKVIKMIIYSDYLYVECSKGLFNFDKDNKIIDDYLCR